MRLNAGGLAAFRNQVSIHAPTWGATLIDAAQKPTDEFQSTHPHGVRQAARTQGCPWAGFNPRTHMGCDLLTLLAVPGLALFQSTHPHGVRQAAEKVKVKVEQFQSTHPHGVRPSYKNIRANEQSFNPRTHMGCDLNLNSQIICFKFQSTHPHGVRLFPFLLLVLIIMFQSTHPHGVRRRGGSIGCHCLVSIHAPTWGATKLDYDLPF